MRIAISGASGLVGSALCHSFARLGHEVSTMQFTRGIAQAFS